LRRRSFRSPRSIIATKAGGLRFKAPKTDRSCRAYASTTYGHSHATQLLLADVHPAVAQERLGHASITTTIDLYVTDDAGRRCGEA